MKLYPALRYLIYLLFSGYRKGHGVHSPFFFQIINTLYRNKSDQGLVYQIAESRRKELLRDNRIIQVTDLGTGKGGMKRVCDITSSSSINVRYGRVLSYFATKTGKNPIVEFGTSVGIGTYYLALSNPDAEVITMEGCPEIAAIATEGFRKSGIGNVETLTGNFDTLALSVFGKCKSPGLIFIDGNHRGEALMRYFNFSKTAVSENTVIIVDDIDYSVNMHLAWKKIIKDPVVTGSIDFGRMGILFFKEGMNKQNYLVRH